MTENLSWRKSSFSGSNGDCFELASPGDHVLVRNSNHPDRGTLALDPSAMAAFVAGCAAGQLDDLA